MKKSGAFSVPFFRSLAKQIASLMERNLLVTLVSSGAIAGGMHRLNVKKRPHLIPEKQALAACGQTALMHTYEKVFGRFGIHVAQILLTRGDLEEKRRYLNARQAIFELLRLKVLPIINENDTVAVDEIQVGDNDNLSALVTNLIEADLLILLTNINGVYTADPKLKQNAKLLRVIADIDEAVHRFASDTKTATSIGGMITKLQAAEMTSHFGIPTVIAKGSKKNIILDILNGKECGTLVLAK
ncbi:MAG: glutamate 5-kinase [Deltaproteobacteria bacterium RIFCSPHIGHO2_12_FULL_44_21]|nr:MAG: glutamate 5-kinase [Deltaproteobacteria bacterium RIFCSPHIGHO2_12_FULL_44_21]